MAILRTPLPENIRGSVDRMVVIKHRLGKTIITAFPDMSKVIYTAKQKAEQKRFADAVAYAKAVIKDPFKKRVYQEQLPKGKRVFNAAISDYMRGKMVFEKQCSDPVLTQLSYAQLPFRGHEGRSRIDTGHLREKSGACRAVFSYDSGPPVGFPDKNSTISVFFPDSF